MNHRDLFSKPTNEYRGKPFWAWNGELKEEELKKQISHIKNMGFGGYFMHSRVGLKTEYLGDKWFQLINACADEGEKLGMQSWLYDEDRWPSGSAGGMVTKNHENRMKFIRMNTGKFKWSDAVICAFSCELDGINFTNLKQITENDQQSGDILWFEVVECPESPNYNGQTYLDTMKRSATDDYIKSTHQKYGEKCGNRLGSSILGVFTDEPHRGELLCDMVASGVNLANCVPYTESFFFDFEQRWGYDLKQKLPFLFLRFEGQVVSEVKWHYCEVAQVLFLNNFMKPVATWCEEHNMHFTGHMLHEDNLAAQTIMNGSLMRCYELMDYPGVDVLTEHNVNYNIVLQLKSVTNQCGQKWLLSELYGCSGWQMDFEKYKNAGDWQALLGINLRCPHLSLYSMEGECKRDYPASIFYQSAWYEEYGYLEDYFARIGVFMANCTDVCHTLVINPIESIWCQVYAGWSNWLSAVSPEANIVEQQFENLYRHLLTENVPFDYGDEEMLSRLFKIDGDILYLKNASYKKVVVCGALTLRSTTVDILTAFERSGGKVIVIGEMPSYVDGKLQEVTLGNAEEALLYADRQVYVNHKDIFVKVKKCEDGSLHIMLLNTNRESSAEGQFFGIDGYYEKWNPQNGTVEAIYKPKTIALCGGESMLLCVSDVENCPKNADCLEQIMLGEIDNFILSEPNVLVLDRVICTVNGKVIEDDILKIDRKLRDEFGIVHRGGAMYQPWFVAKNGINQYGEISLSYSIASQIDTEAYLVLEQSERYNIMVNNQCVTEVCGYFVDIAFQKVKIIVKKGINHITLNTVFADDTNLEAMYIIGDFGVYHDEIVPMPSSIAFGDIRSQGFPYYSGKITYIFDQLVQCKSKISFDNLCGGACIKVNGSVVAWKPYETAIEPCEKIEVELILTRRNTFGPLHLLPAVDGAYGPDSFMSEGEQWSDNAVTLPCGLNKFCKSES